MRWYLSTVASRACLAIGTSSRAPTSTASGAKLDIAIGGGSRRRPGCSPLETVNKSRRIRQTSEHLTIVGGVTDSRSRQKRPGSRHVV